MRISLNLASRPYVDLGTILRQARIASAVLAVLSLGFGAGLHLLHGSAERARQRSAELDRATSQVQARHQGYEMLMNKSDNQRLVAETAALNDLFVLKSFSWTLAMQNLETVLPAGVQVLTLEPERQKDGRISVHMLVGGPRERVVDFVSALEHSARFRNPYIKGETAEQANNGPQQRLEPINAQTRFTFDIMADYNPPAPGERLAASKPPANDMPSDAAPDTAQSPTAHAGRKPYQAGGRR